MSKRTITRVVVFGGTGFLGRVIVGCLAADGYRVRAVARRPLPEWPASPTAAIEFFQADVRVEDEVAAALTDMDAAVNAVSLYVEQHGASFEAIHVEAAARIARLAHAQGLGHLVHLSGIGVDASSRSAYVRARAKGEDAVRAAFPCAAILRPSLLVSTEGGMLETLEGVARLPVVPLFGTGSVHLQPVDVADAARAVREVIGRSVEGIIELGGADVIRYRELLEAIQAASGRRRPMLPLPMPIWHTLAGVLSLLPSPPLTRDQLVLMSEDNVVASGARGFEALGLVPRGVREVLHERAWHG